MFNKLLKAITSVPREQSVTISSSDEADIFSSSGYKVLRNIIDNDINTDTYCLTNEQPPKDGGEFDADNCTYIPVDALTATVPGDNEFTGMRYFARLFPHEYGNDIGDSSKYYVSGYVPHEDDYGYTSMAFCGLDTMDNWENIYDSAYGFLVYFTYVGYSDELSMAYGIYENHEQTSL
jgi:hypothetical protein